MNRPVQIPRPIVVQEHLLTFFGELALDAIRALRVPAREGEWDLHRWDSTGRGI